MDDKTLFKQVIFYINFEEQLFTKKKTLTHKQLETHERIFRAVATDVLMLKHQALSIHNAV